MTHRARRRPLSEIAATPAFRTIDGVAIRFVESEPGGRDALLLSPWPESVFAYESIWQRLAANTRLVAIDLPGFGRSRERRTLMTPRAMGEFVVRAADAFGLEHPHVIAPDVGTSAALFAATAHPNRFLSLIVGGGGTVVPIQLGAPLREWVFAPDLEPFRRIDGRRIVEKALQTMDRYVVTDIARRDYLASYAGKRFARSMRYAQSYPTELEALRDVLPRTLTPVRIIAGRRDAVVPLVNAQYLHERLPHSDLQVVDGSHFVWEDAGDEYAALVEGWWDGGFLMATPVQVQVQR